MSLFGLGKKVDPVEEAKKVHGSFVESGRVGGRSVPVLF